jgi:hypothetical protein
MKTFVIIATALLIAGSATVRAQETDEIHFNVPITFSGKLSTGETVTDASLNEGSLTFAEVQFISGTFTDQPVYVIGAGLGLTNTVVGFTTNVNLIGVSVWSGENSVVTSKPGSKTTTTVMGMSENQIDIFADTLVTNADTVISNSVLLLTVTTSISGKGTNVNDVSAKFSGIWYDGVSAISGSIKTAK